MKSKRISRREVETLADRITAMATEVEMNAILAKRDDIFDLIADHINPPEVVEAIEKLPGWCEVRSTSSIAIEVERYRHLRLDRSDDREVYLSCRLSIADLPAEIQQAIHGYDAALSDFDERRRRLRLDLLKNIQSAGTTKALAEAWPEAASVISEVCGVVADVEQPLESILGRWLKALPAPDKAA